jgi:hypothetical protein
MRSWGRGVFRNLSDVPRPTDDPRVHASGVNSDRILLFGSGPAVGWGVMSHELALPGSLARAVSTLTGRGADVDVVSDPAFKLTDAIREFGAINLARYDAIVITLGLMEAVGLTSASSWRRDLGKLLTHLGEMVPHTPIFLVGIHPTTQITRYDVIVGPIIAHHRTLLNRVTAGLSAHLERVTFIPFEPTDRSQFNRYRTKSEYRDGGILLAAWIAPVLDADVRASDSRRSRVGGLDTLARRNALERFDILETTSGESFERLTEFARRSLHAQGANLTIVGSDRFWTTASRGHPSTEGPGSDSICFTTIQHEDALVISNASRDPRFADMGRIKGPPPVRFYAGYRVEAPNGVPIGVLCVHDWIARDVTEVDQAVLRDIALLVQKEIWIASQGSTPSGYVTRRQPSPVRIPVERTFAPASSRR